MKFIFMIITTILTTKFRVEAQNTKLKILFADDEETSPDENCKIFENQVLWKLDGKCYTLGDRGPCEEDETLSIGPERSPFCKPTKIKQTVSKIISFDDNFSKTATKGLETNSSDSCEAEWKVSVNGSCYDLLEQGPCVDGDWLVWTGDQGAQCLARPCDQTSVWWPHLCDCVAEAGTRYTDQDICGDNETLVWSPYGEGVCACQEGYETDGEGGPCYQLGGVGPCDDGQVWDLVPDTEVGQCQPNVTVRVFDTIPTTAELRSAQLTRCSADENGKCRKSLKLRNRIGLEFAEWLDTFKPRGTVDGTCSVATCDGDQIPWVDGQCYQLASTGPCDQDQWLVLDNIVDGLPRATCQNRRCGDTGVWMSQNCTCVTPKVTSRNSFSVSTGGLCEDGEVILVSPYGDGVCTPIWNDGEDQSLYHGVFEIASRRNCHAIDGKGSCNTSDDSSNVEGRIEAISDGDTLIQLITWLEQFKRPSEDQECTNENFDDDIPAVIDVEEFINVGFKNSTESECHREGKVLFENGECYNLLERGPCFDKSMWLVMTVQGNGDLRAECRDRKCLDGESVWEPVTCQCYPGHVSEPCDLGERLYVDIFGQGVCGCGPHHGLWDEDGGCYKLGELGPCSDSSHAFVLNTETGATECKIPDNDDDDVDESNEEEESSTSRILDLLSGGKLNPILKENILRATPKTCQLDARGKCRRKVNHSRDENGEADTGTEFRLWLQSFQKRAPNNFQCSS